MSYTIRQVCERTGLTAHTLRYYEKEGLLPAVARSGGGIRLYSDEDLELLGLICCLKNTGMPLSGIADFVRLTQEGEHTLRERCEILRRHRDDVIARMAEIRQHLEKVDCKLACFTEKLEDFEARQAAKGRAGSIRPA